MARVSTSLQYKRERNGMTRKKAAENEVGSKREREAIQGEGRRPKAHAPFSRLA
jgi:hypothetical protein